MNSNESKVQEILKQRGIDTAAVDDATEADIPEPCDRFKQLMEVYYTLKVSADMETPYWISTESGGRMMVIFLKLEERKLLRADMLSSTPTIPSLGKTCNEQV